MCIFFWKKSKQNGTDNGTVRPLLKRHKNRTDNGTEIIPLNDTEIAVLREISKNPYIKSIEIAKKTNHARSTVSRAIKELKARGFIQRRGSDIKGYWKISEQR
ncbi:MarR family transcriptional regulator [Candidatus Saccharibacteria bacterium]|nr:MarR family transcriptional regulator [Candidatus Saccharibacteria bacterium]MCL1963343.1 MarR family transcriptional regulator [Candidatus Saccharibacteria bacterium]